jgi:hypothetical protein
VSQLIEVACRAADRGWFDVAVATSQAVPVDARERPAALSLIASVHRQLGDHAAAEAFDREGVDGRVADPLGTTMCRIGLAADRVGAADAVGAGRALQTADLALSALPPWHWATRWFDPWLTRAWVAAEIALLSNDPLLAVAELEPFALARPDLVPTTRAAHERAKTLLFLGVAERTAGLPQGAEHVRGAARVAAQADLAPLLVPCAELLAELDPDRADQWQDVAHRARARIAAHRPGA